MRKGFFREHATMILIICTALIALVVLSLINANKEEDYAHTSLSSYGRGDYGAKGLYLSYEEYCGIYDIDIERYSQYARFLPSSSLIVIVSPSYTEMIRGSEAVDLCDKVLNGSSILLVNDATEFVREASLGTILSKAGYAGSTYDIEEETVGEMNVRVCTFKEGGGAIYDISTERDVAFLNNILKEDPSVAASLLVYSIDICNTKGYDTVVFDDFYVGIQESSFVEILGMGMVLGCIELMIAVIALFIYKGVRFGAPIAQPAIEKRSETEHMQALAELYKRTDSTSIAFMIHMDSLLDDAAKVLGLESSIRTTARDELFRLIREDKNMKALGLPLLLDIYENIDRAHISQRELRIYLSKIDSIRKEL